MASILSAGTTLSTALVASADTTGILQLASNNGTVAVTINTSQNVGIGTTSPAYKFDVAGAISTNNNLTFTGAGNRITGDFSNGTVTNRVSIQNSITNATTNIHVLPNGTATNAAISLESDSAATTGSFGQFIVLGASDVRIISGIRGAGTYLPMTFYTNGSERVRIDTSGNLLYGQTSSATSGRGVTINATQQGVISRNGLADYNELGVWAGTTDQVKAQIQANQSSTGAVLFGSRTNHPVYFTVNDTEKVRIDTSGKVGIGTASPSLRLTVEENGNQVRLRNTTTRYRSDFSVGAGSGMNINSYDDTSAVYMPFNIDASVITFSPSSAEKVRITSAGYVGIGTTSPGTRLVIDTGSTTNAGAQLLIGPSSGTAVVGDKVLIGFKLQNTAGGGTGFEYAAGIAGIQDQSASNGGALGFYTQTSAGSTPERMRIDYLGNVGIGTTSISALLHVASGTAGILNFRTGTWAAKIFQQNDVTDYNGLIVGNRWAGDSSTVFEVGTLYGGGSAWGSFYKVSGSGLHTFGVSNGSAAPNERVRINDFGIGLNGSSPTSGIGIMFPATQSASSNANTLDDYEEGTWTPVVAGTTGGTYSNQAGRYTKIGRVVTCDFFLQLSNITFASSSDAFTITGLPFVPAGWSYRGITGSMWSQAFNFNNTQNVAVDFVTPLATTSSSILFQTSASGSTAGEVRNENNSNPILTGQVVYTV
jgi:hypothetical protein